VSWLRPRRAPAPAAPAAPPPEVHRSLALASLFAGLVPESRLDVLDLGPAVGANVDFLAQRFVCRLQVGDLYRSLAAETERRGGDDPEEDPEALLRAALPAPPERRCDLVFAWDLFDYLSKPRLRALARLLAERCRPGARLFAMVAIGKEIPATPTTYLFHDEESLLYRDRPAATRPGPRYRPSEVAELTPGFTVDRSFLLRHGVQEYLLERQAS
jgi:Methyltransferase domain